VASFEPLATFDGRMSTPAKFELMVKKDSRQVDRVGDSRLFLVAHGEVIE
jgi:hypothetical protein